MKIGSKIREERKKQNITQKELAEKTNISRSYLSDIEHNRYCPSVKLLDRIMKALGCEIQIVCSIEERKVNICK